MTVSVVANAASPGAELKAIRFDRVASLPRPGKKDGSAFVPARLKPLYRLALNVVAMTALVADFDGLSPEAYASTRARLEQSGLEFWFYETFSHGADGLCSARAVIPFAAEMPLAGLDWRATRAALLDGLGLLADADPKCADPARLYFMPRHPAGESRESFFREGHRLDWSPFAVASQTAPAPVPRLSFLPASPAVLTAAREALELHGPAIDQQGGNDHTFRAAAILTHDFALSESEAWALFVEWNDRCAPPWSETDLRTFLRNGAKYASGEFGCKRARVAPVIAVKALIADWGRKDEAIPALLEAVREIMRQGISSDDRTVIEILLLGETGWTKRQLNLPRAVDLEKLAEREARQQSFATGAPDLVDAKDNLNTSRQFLQSGADQEGFSRIVRFGSDFYVADTSATFYRPASDEEIYAEIYKWLDGKIDLLSGNRLKPDRNTVETLSHALKATARVDAPAIPCWREGGANLRAAEDLIPVANGLLCSRSRELMPPTRNYLGVAARGYAYDPSAGAPSHWLRFLLDLWPDDAESIETLQEIFGLLLTSDTRHQKLFLILGPKRAGKGNIFRVLREIVGPANVAAPTLAQLGGPFGMQGLIGKLAALVSDARLSPKTDVGQVAENLLRTSGEDAISVQRKHREDVTSKLSCRWVLATNELPPLLDQSGALASRFIILKLSNSFFGREDMGLTDRLLSELPQIFNWSLDGLQRLHQRGYFRQPASAAATVLQLEALSSPIAAFTSECCELAPGATVTCEALYSAWCMWCAQQGREHAGTAQIFGRNLSAAFPELRVVQPRVGGKRHRNYEGIRLAAVH